MFGMNAVDSGKASFHHSESHTADISSVHEITRRRIGNGGHEVLPLFSAPIAYPEPQTTLQDPQPRMGGDVVHTEPATGPTLQLTLRPDHKEGDQREELEFGIAGKVERDASQRSITFHLAFHLFPRGPPGAFRGETRAGEAQQRGHHSPLKCAKVPFS
jgi:hypothetical protein